MPELNCRTASGSERMLLAPFAGRSETAFVASNLPLLPLADLQFAYITLGRVVGQFDVR